jgi:DNA-binding MarR family transcriptional regulator
MTENGYITQERSVHDKRSIRVKLTAKGSDLCKILDEMFVRHEDKLKSIGIENPDLVDLNHTMKQLERFWASQTSFTGLASLDDSDF